MSWLSKIFKGKGEGEGADNAEDIVRFYQQLGFFSNAGPGSVVAQYTYSHGEAPSPTNPWDDVFLLVYSEDDVWVGDPEADVCAEEQVYSEVLAEWARISHGTFAPDGIAEHWDSDTGPITVSFELGGQRVSISPSYQDDWMDLDILRQINRLVGNPGRQFECAADANFALVLSLTPEQKRVMQTQRRFPFSW